MSALRHPDPFVKIEAAVVGPVGDKHHLMAADIFLEGEGVRVHMALHCWLISNTPLKVVAGMGARGARLALLDQIAVMRTRMASVGLFC